MALISKFIPPIRLDLVWRALTMLGLVSVTVGFSVEVSRVVSSMENTWITQGISFGLGASVSIVLFFMIGLLVRNQSVSNSELTKESPIPENVSRSSRSKSFSTNHNNGPFDELKLKNCAVMLGVADTESVTYLIPCIGNVSRTSESLPQDSLSRVLESAAKLRENGVAVKVLIPDNEYPGAIFFPPMSKYAIGVRQFPVPKSFFSGN